jgi:hypothetical protein
MVIGLCPGKESAGSKIKSRASDVSQESQCELGERRGTSAGWQPGPSPVRQPLTGSLLQAAIYHTGNGRLVTKLNDQSLGLSACDYHRCTDARIRDG